MSYKIYSGVVLLSFISKIISGNNALKIVSAKKQGKHAIGQETDNSGLLSTP